MWQEGIKYFQRILKFPSLREYVPNMSSSFDSINGERNGQPYHPQFEDGKVIVEIILYFCVILNITSMHIETRKLLLIEEMLKVKSEATLVALENLLKVANNKTVKKTPSVRDFSVIWSKAEAEEMERIIAESCETIHPDD